MGLLILQLKTLAIYKMAGVHISSVKEQLYFTHLQISFSLSLSAIHSTHLHGSMNSRRDQLLPIPTQDCPSLQPREHTCISLPPRTSPTLMPTVPMAVPPRTSIDSLISFLHHHLRALLADPAALHAARRRSLALLAPPPRHRRYAHSSDEQDDAAVLAALHGAIDAFLLPASVDGDAACCLAGVEEALQAPALLPEHGETAGLDNRGVAACAYFYLALVRSAQGDAWQSAMHFLQAVAVSPAAVAAGDVERGLAPRALWEGLFDEAVLARAGGAGEEDAVRRAARRYKDWLMYYKVVAGAGSGGCLQLGRSGSSVVRRWPNFSEDRTTRSVDHEGMSTASTSHGAHDGFTELKDFLSIADEDYQEDTKGSYDSRCLHEMLEESQSDSPVSFYSHLDSSEESDSEVAQYNKGRSAKIMPIDADFSSATLHERSSHNKNLTWCTSPENAMIYAPESPMYHVNDHEMKPNYLQSNRSHGSLNNLSNSVLGLKSADSYSTSNYSAKDDMFPQCSPRNDLRCFSNFSTKFIKKSALSDLVSRGSMSRKFKTSATSENWSNASSLWGKDSQADFIERFEKAVSKLLVSDGLESCLDAGSEVTTIWQLLNNTSEIRHKSSVRQDILDQLLDSISTSKKDKVIRASVYVLLLMISEDRNVMRGIKRKDFHLSNLAIALKRDVHEAAILIYLLDPTPLEIKNLDLLPTLLHVACNSDAQKWPTLLPLTPTSASIALIEILVTAFDYVTNNVHLAALSSPPILSKLVDVAKNNNLEEGVALAAILVRCVRLNGNCKKFLSQATPVDPFLHLLRRKGQRAKCAALEYFHEILQIPRSSANCLLQEIRHQGGIAIMHTLMASLHQTELEHRVLAANLLLQLDMMEKSDGRSVFKDEAMEVLLDSLSSQKNSQVQALSASFLSNLGGTYSWSGESYTAAWLAKKAGLTSTSHRNTIRNIDWLDSCLQDTEISTWSSKSARAIIKIGVPVIGALAKGMQSKVKGTSHDCLVCAAWLGSELAALGENDVRYYACEILLHDIASHLHPGFELDERVLACMCLYNYTSGKGKQMLMSLSEGSRESLRRLSSFTWMAEELLQVTDYFLPNKLRVSCVHTQILEIGQPGNGAATAIAFFRGQLFAGYSNGTIRAWDIKGQRAVIIREVKEHKKAVTCFAVSETGENLLSGSADKSIRVWKMAHRKLECVQVIQIREPVQKFDICSDQIIVQTHNNVLKFSCASRSTQTFYRSKHVKSLAIYQGKAYLGCRDLSIQELDTSVESKIEIRAPTKSWRIRKQSISSIVVYKDWMYCAGAQVEGSTLKDWKKRCKPNMKMPIAKGTNVEAMAVVEDFIYLNCSKNPSIIQIWLREKQQKVGRLSAGSKITSMFTANDMIFCGTETGLIKAWIPL
ncbi:putative E3 ubiquitin-protein ligase LIN-1 isoform X2 [Phragmites australis]|uniref:putative E3 ubiquitin-protein ligase LIN-1 isoform X2 n=1 Tax=Phragmites australis TaxID=29695 RepID=UPI002D78F255|nr:putative E3 ubiquitin-protein ligase LIN-1 isoform X2 [Phragmites australis]